MRRITTRHDLQVETDGHRSTQQVPAFANFQRQFLRDLEKQDSEIEAAATQMSFEQICKQNQRRPQPLHSHAMPFHKDDCVLGPLQVNGDLHDASGSLEPQSRSNLGRHRMKLGGVP